MLTATRPRTNKGVGSGRFKHSFKGCIALQVEHWSNLFRRYHECRHSHLCLYVPPTRNDNMLGTVIAILPTYWGEGNERTIPRSELVIYYYVYNTPIYPFKIFPPPTYDWAKAAVREVLRRTGNQMNMALIIVWWFMNRIICPPRDHSTPLSQWLTAKAAVRRDWWVKAASPRMCF